MMDEIIITRASNGWVVRNYAPYRDPGGVAVTADVAVAETPGSLACWVGEWATAQAAEPKEQA